MSRDAAAGAGHAVAASKEIRFYSRGDPKYFFLSNFFEAPFVVGGVTYPTVEHFFQASKFAKDPELQKAIATASTPREAKRLGGTRSEAFCKDWGTKRDGVMATALRAKFGQHADLQARLLATAGSKLIEAAPGDKYWGCGKDGSGVNRLGALLMELRDELLAVTVARK